MTTKTTKNQNGTFHYTRADERKEFLCERCNREKVSKITVVWQDKQGEKKTICNGCYGFLIKKE